MSYAGTAALSFGVCAFLWLAGPIVSFRQGLKALVYCCAGPLAGYSYGVALLAIVIMAAGLVFPRNPLTRLAGSLAVAAWFALGLAFSAQRFM